MKKNALEDVKSFCFVNRHDFVMLFETIPFFPFSFVWLRRIGFSYILVIPSQGSVIGIFFY